MKEHTGISRRSFLTGIAATGALTAIGLTGCTTATASGTTYDAETEVLVCGYGASGAAAAIDAADNSSKVLIIEKASLPGGSMARCGGAIMGGGTKVQEELGVTDSPDGLYDWVKTCVNQNYILCPDDIIRTYADNAGANVDWLMDMCTQYCDRDLFDVALATENNGATGAVQASGNGVTAGCLDATGCEYEKFGLSKTEAVPRSHWAHSYGNAANSGPELFLPLYQNINSKIDEGSVTTRFNTALKGLIQADDGTITGIVATDESGNEIKIKATKGVMLATGGYPASDDMKMSFCQDALKYTTYMCYDCTGDGIRAAMGVGADLYNMCNFYPIAVAQTYQYDPQYNKVFNSWLDMDSDGYMEVPAMNMAECHGGMKINTDAQVLDINGKTIPHLYASGCDTGTNIFGVAENYPGCGCYVSFSICYGRIAGVNMSNETAVG